VTIVYMGEGLLLGTSQLDTNSNSDHQSHRGCSQRGNQTCNMTNQGLEVMNPQPMLYPAMQLLAFFHPSYVFWTSFGMLDLVCMSNVSGLIAEFGIRTPLWLWSSTRFSSSRALAASRKNTMEEDDERIR